MNFILFIETNIFIVFLNRRANNPIDLGVGFGGLVSDDKHRPAWGQMEIGESEEMP